jgi:hypothetical protein
MSGIVKRIRLEPKDTQCRKYFADVCARAAELMDSPEFREHLLEPSQGGCRISDRGLERRTRK